MMVKVSVKAGGGGGGGGGGGRGGGGGGGTRRHVGDGKEVASKTIPHTIRSRDHDET